MKVSDVARNAACNAIVDLVDGGSGAGTIKIFTGAAPTNTTDGDSGTLLATLTFSDPAFGNAAAGVATADTITPDASIDATGTAAHYRVKDSDGVVIWQGTVGTSAADIIFNTVAFVTGASCSISLFTVTVPAT